ncbi:MAG: BatD family protein [Verrucomicrobiota bacterium]
MKTWKHFILTFQALAVWITFCAYSHGQAMSRLSSSFIARGEQAMLEVAVTGGVPIGFPQVTPPQNVTIQETDIGPATQLNPGRKLEYVFQYKVFSYETGKYKIPPITVNVNGATPQSEPLEFVTEPLEFVIFDPDELEWSELAVEGRKIRYASFFRSLNDRPYENETTPTEIKIFVPREMVVVDWGIPDFERDGLAAWRFQPSPMRSTINLLGTPYFSVAYPSTITPTRTGKISIGPAKIRLITQENVMDPFPRWVNKEIYVQAPKLEMEALPLPAGAPKGFENAVGSFRLSASSEVSEIQEGDPVTVDLVVTGSGNLDTLQPPTLADSDGWKVYSTTNDQRGDERRDLSGSVVFHQSIRPLEMKKEIPPFRLVYFDPGDKTYKTVTTEPIALRMIPGPAKAAEAIAQSLPVPFERMTDILALLRPAQLTVPAIPAFPTWLGHAVGALLALLLIVKAVWMRLAVRLSKNPESHVRARELQEISSAKSADDTDFLRATGSFIERHLGSHPSPEIRAVLAERDAVCFRAEKPKSVLDRKRRDEIIRLLRNAAMMLLVVFTLNAGGTARADDISKQAIEAFDSAKYEDAIKLWLSAGNYDDLSADTLYNIGNACYRSGSPGHAALYYRRALVKNSGHQEARQNLRFIERKYGSITVQRPDYQYALARLPLVSWKNTLWGGLWICGLALLVFPATLPGARVRWVAVGALVIGPLLVSAGLLGWRYFPNDAEFAPVSKQAVIIAEQVALHTDAARTSPEVIDAPPGSLCEVIRESGRWTYVAFASKTRGWIPKEAIEKVQPVKAPAPPKFRKPKADGKSA